MNTSKTAGISWSINESVSKVSQSPSAFISPAFFNTFHLSSKQRKVESWCSSCFGIGNKYTYYYRNKKR